MHRLLDAGFSYAGFVTVAPDPHGLAAARRKIRTVARELDFNRGDVDDLLIAVGEALSNAYLYGSPSKIYDFIQVGWYFEDQMLTFLVKDCGRGLRSGSAESRTAAGHRGMGCGIRLMRKTSDEVNFQFEGGTQVMLKKRHSLPVAADLAVASALR